VYIIHQNWRLFVVAAKEVGEGVEDYGGFLGFSDL
jgi:hypothetical protein